MKINNELIFEINGEKVTHDIVYNWEYKRMIAVHKTLARWRGLNFHRTLISGSKKKI